MGTARWRPESSALLLMLCTWACERPATSLASWRLVQALAIGTDNEGPASFGDVRAIGVDRRAQIWIIDYADQHVQVFDSTGRFLWTLGRRGAGPGEFQSADGMALGQDGTMWIHDPANARFTGYSDAGQLVGTRPAPTNTVGYIWFGQIGADGRVWDPLGGWKSDDAFLPWRVFGSDFASVDTIGVPNCTTRAFVAGPGVRAPGTRRPAASGGAPPGPRSGFDPDRGLVCIPYSAEYRAVILAPRGDTAGVISSAPRPRQAEGEEDLENAYFDDQGRIWLRRGSTGPIRFDVFTATGSFIAEVTSSIVSRPYFRPLFRRGTVYLISGGRDDTPRVVKARLVRPSP